jgi:ABC-type bacteriocin/lantibiotic exporter with double-glycine peptidase domain
MLRRFPHEYQMDAKNCGTACLKIIAKYYGKYCSLQYLRDLCGCKADVNKNGYLTLIQEVQNNERRLVQRLFDNLRYKT